MNDLSPEIEAYLDGAPEPQRTTLQTMRSLLAELLPEAEQGIAYGIPSFKVAGVGVAGLGYSKSGCSYYPMSGSITAELADALSDYATSKGSLRFAADEPLPRELVKRLVDARLQEIAREAD